MGLLVLVLRRHRKVAGTACDQSRPVERGSETVLLLLLQLLE